MTASAIKIGPLTFLTLTLASILNYAEAQNNCELMPMMNGPNAGKSVYMCLDSDGVWRQRVNKNSEIPKHNITNPTPPSATQKEEIKYRNILEKTVIKDSNSWSLNKYDVGSMKRIEILSRSKNGIPSSIMGEYTYNGGMRGWVKANLLNGDTIECLNYHDMGFCRPPRTEGKKTQSNPKNANNDWNNLYWKDRTSGEERRRMQEDFDVWQSQQQQIK